MDQRIDFLTKLKDTLPKHHPKTVQFTCQQPQKTNDEDYLRLRGQVMESTFFREANKHTRIRLTNWIKMLDGVKANKVWKMNRDNYVKLMALMCHCGFLIAPFHQLPPSEELPNIRKHEINEILNRIERELKNSNATSRRSSRDNLASYHKLKTESMVYEQNSTLPLLLRQTPLATQQSQIPVKKTEEDEENSFDLSESQVEQTQEERQSRVSSLKAVQSNGVSMCNPLQDKTLNILVPPNTCSSSEVIVKIPPLYPSGGRTDNKITSSKIRQTISHWTNNHSQVQNARQPPQDPASSQIEEVELTSYRESGQGCSCGGGTGEEGWFGAFLRKILPS